MNTSHSPALVLAIVAQKGGVGKTSTALAFSAGLALKGKRVLCIDMDAQGNLSQTMRAAPGGLSVLDVLTRKATAQQTAQQTEQGNIIPASPALAGADAVITATGKEYRLREALEPLRSMYDYIVIDTPPALGILTVNALTAADVAIIPAQADIYSLQSIQQLYETIETVQRYCNPGLKVDGILLTRYSPRAVLSRDLAEAASQAAEAYNTRLYKTAIRENIAVKEAQLEQTNIFQYAPKSNAAMDYAAAIEEFMEENKK